MINSANYPQHQSLETLSPPTESTKVIEQISTETTLTLEEILMSPPPVEYGRKLTPEETVKLREWLARPGKKTWEKIMAFLLPPNKKLRGDQVIIEYIKGHMRGWDPQFRTIPEFLRRELDDDSVNHYSGVPAALELVGRLTEKDFFLAKSIPEYFPLLEVMSFGEVAIFDKDVPSLKKIVANCDLKELEFCSYLRECTLADFGDIHSLRKLGIKGLYDKALSSLHAIGECRELRHLKLGVIGKEEAKSLGWLTNLKQLRSLSLWGQDIDLRPIRALSKLRDFQIKGAKMESLTCLKNAQHLRKIKCEKCSELKDISTLNHLRRLEEAIFRNCNQASSTKKLRRRGVEVKVEVDQWYDYDDDWN